MYFNLIQNKQNIIKNLQFAYYFYIRNFVKLGYIFVTGNRKQSGKIVGKRIISPNESNHLLFTNLLKDETPFLAGRFGGTEISFVLGLLMLRNRLIDTFPREVLINGKTKSGIFPISEEIAARFGQVYIESFKEIDMLAYWGFILMEEYLIKKYTNKAIIFPSRSFEPFQFEEPWTFALTGKKILVVHPFEKTILLQYQKREKLFKNPKILPEFDLITLKAVQSIGDSECEHKDWFEALDYMFNEAKKKDFDIAILSCGAYGLPLAAKLKAIGKKAIVLGGMTQLLFGIKGARWEASRPDIVTLYNESWVRASETERPPGAEKIEDSAYW